MGILPKHLELLAIEQKRTPHFIKGDVLTLGQQSVYATLNEVLTIFSKHKISINPLPDGIDTKNKIPHWVGTPYENRTNAQTVLTLLGADSVCVADISPYENPEYIIDLNNKIDSHYEQKFDVIFDVGTLEHIFDIPTALQNLTKMLKPDGRIILILPASNAIDHGFYQFSPTLFYDFFSCNGFENFSCYLIEGNPLNYLRKGNIWRYTGFGKECPLITPKAVEVFFTATKQHIPKEFEKPIQKIYTDLWKRGEGCISIPESEIKKEVFLKKMRNVRDKTWKLFPEFIETGLIKKFIGNKNLIFIGKY